MTYLYDASAIVNLVKKGYVKILTEGYSLDLAIYEALNAIWKEYKKLNRIDDETAENLVGLIIETMRLMQLLDISDDEINVYRLALREDLTIYDAAYLKKAMELRAVLVTDDKILKEKAKKYVYSLTTDELIAKEKPL